MAEWTLHRQPKDQIIDHEFSIWCDDVPVVLANNMPGEEGVLATIVSRLNSHDALVNALEQISQLTEALRQGGPDPMDLQGLSDALEIATSVAHDALTAVVGGAR